MHQILPILLKLKGTTS
ncbi:hypothetical protein Gohar_004371 [Gossypium harknessii]|uniref:Uncharacterized protein n=5 Tax=Gossypium TaxID=3633 RepID=A0A7J9JHN9_9ROSI|nr:hypothetical protein [Gossypium davidsonii]MBA0655660.1 hypothetical protein [Gossypium klotzschianum]MBA0717361.1 hypothetical protein [Gossypium laxum]MBA0804805.1 hypothetical protein [Gossypium harknessii]MBA0833930.1 hypothetical protein [Gossypium armourianum]